MLKYKKHISVPWIWSKWYLICYHLLFIFPAWGISSERAILLFFWSATLLVREIWLILNILLEQFIILTPLTTQYNFENFIKDTLCTYTYSLGYFLREQLEVGGNIFFHACCGKMTEKLFNQISFWMNECPNVK